MAEFVLEGRSGVRPTIYAFRYASGAKPGLLKVGYTGRPLAERKREVNGGVKAPVDPYEFVYAASAMRADGTGFSDHEVHRALARMGVRREEGEWFRCGVETVEAAVLAVRNRIDNVEKRTRDFGMRPEQEAAVARTADYFARAGEGARFLWNAKMRFGKTFAAYQLARRLGLKRVLILTFKPAVVSAWEEDLRTHVDFEGWQFIRRPRADEPELGKIDEQFARADKARPIVCFGSFQDFLGLNELGGIKAHHRWLREEVWNLVIFDEYHFGAWRQKAKALFGKEDEEAEVRATDAAEEAKPDGEEALSEADLSIAARRYLYLSGTPFRSLNEGEFLESQIYSWTYGDEQAAKEAWAGLGPNPYVALPKMALLTYRLPAAIRKIAEQGEFNEFDLNVFFSTTGSGETARFVYEAEVQQWLDWVRGHGAAGAAEALRAGERRELPFADATLADALRHTLWFLPDVAACEAMAALLRAKRNVWWHDFKVALCAGPHAGMGAEALDEVERAMGDPQEGNSITLTCGKLTTGVTVRPWGGIFMLRNLQSPETYFQAAFRVQSPWTAPGEDGSGETVIKPVCYVIDFAPNRALRQVANYSGRLAINEDNPGTDETRVGEFIHFLPMLYSEGGTLRLVKAEQVLEMAMTGEAATLLARRWQSALLVNVDNETLKHLLANEAAMRAIDAIIQDRALGREAIETLINRSEAIKKVKRDGTEKAKPASGLTKEEKEIRNKRKQIQEKLITFAARIPVFMYLTDDREHTLREVILQVETDLFKRVTGLTLDDFRHLVSLHLFNDAKMNEAVLGFKRYEDASLAYAGVNRHAGETPGGW